MHRRICGAYRREMDRQQRVIEESLRSTFAASREGGSTQEDLITIRGERFVIPVKSEHKRRIPGVVHGASSSGQTVYLEPLETIEQNNELVRLIEEEQAEIRRIFLAMTREIGVQSHAIAQVRRFWRKSTVCRLGDALPPIRVRTSAVCRCSAPVLELTQGRHPLLESGCARGGQPSFPLTLELNDAQRQLIVSGPNTGGKTVALKTTGLLGIWRRRNSSAGCGGCFFRSSMRFLADIGDAQSN